METGQLGHQVLCGLEQKEATMTVIVASSKLGVMAADTVITDTARNLILGYAEKIIKGPDGTLAGAAGDCEPGNLMLDWVKRGRPGKPQIKWFKSASLLLLLPDRSIIWYDESHIPEVMIGGFVCIGHGAPFAHAVMAIGGSPLDAVRAASHVSVYCGGEPTLLSLEN
jgi:hypothetical protein